MKRHFLIQVEDSLVNGSSVMGDYVINWCVSGPWAHSLKGYAEISVHLCLPV